MKSLKSWIPQGLLCSCFLAFAVPGCGPAGPAAPSGSKPVEKAASTGGATEKNTDKNDDGGKESASQPAAAVVTNPATITGKVAFTGNPPPRVPIQMAADANCAALHSQPVFPDDVVVNDNKTLRWVFVYVSKGITGKNFPVPQKTVVFDQRGCRYDPHVFGIMAKQKLDILNSDSTNHNVHSLPKSNREFNRGMPTKGMKITESFSRAESPVKIKCEVHPWMAAWCHVMDHPYFAVTDEQGVYTIGNLPPGKYTLTAWHEKYGPKVQDIEVGPNETKGADFEFKG